MALKEWTDYLIQRIDETLRPLGYKKRGLQWRKDINDIQAWISIQKGKYNHQQYLRWYCHLSVGSYPISSQKLGPTWTSVNPKGHWSRSLNSLPECPGHYDVSSDEELESNVDAFLRDLLTIGFKQIESQDSTEKIVMRLRDLKSKQGHLSDFSTWMLFIGEMYLAILKEQSASEEPKPDSQCGSSQ